MKKDLKKRVNEFIDSLDENESAVVLAYEGDEMHYASYSSVNELAPVIATIFEDYYENNFEKAKVFAEAVVGGLYAYLANGTPKTHRVAHMLAEASIKGIKKHLESVVSGKENDDEEDCSDCELVKKCQLPQAVKYRKENGIKPAKKHHCKNKNSESN